MCGTTELFSDVLINLCHIMDFGSGQQLILINVECMFSVGMSVLLVSQQLFSVLIICNALAVSKIWYQSDDAFSC